MRVKELLNASRVWHVVGDLAVADALKFSTNSILLKLPDKLSIPLDRRSHVEAYNSLFDL